MKRRVAIVGGHTRHLNKLQGQMHGLLQRSLVEMAPTGLAEAIPKSMAELIRLQEFKALEDANWPDKLREIVRCPELLENMGTADLKRAGKMLSLTLIRVGERCAKAELQVGKLEKAVEDLLASSRTVAEAAPKSDEQLARDLDRVTARALTLTGGRPPAWSYLYKEACELLHEYTAFEVKKTAKGYSVIGVDDAGKRYNLYDFDHAGLGVVQSASEARLMAAHLRQSFLPRNPNPEE